jgi:1,4-dihydroxy-2-naphthoate octaprenyltransferase
MGLLAANILLVNNYRDAETDAAANKRTLVVRLGRGFARGQFTSCAALALGVPVLYTALGFGPWCLLPLLLAPFAWIHVRRLAYGRTPAEYVALLGDTGRFMAAYAALFAAGMLL